MPPLNPADISAYRHARSLPELGALGARWLRSESTFIPTHVGAGPDPETHLDPCTLPALLAINEAGWLTVSSQPGLQSTTIQRAYVSGVASWEISEAVLEASLGTDLIVLVAAGESSTSIPVSATQGEIHTWGGRGGLRDTTELYRDYSPEALPALESAYALEVIDPVWGRNDLLWPWLLGLSLDLG